MQVAGPAGWQLPIGRTLMYWTAKSWPITPLGMLAAMPAGSIIWIHKGWALTGNTTQATTWDFRG